MHKHCLGAKCVIGCGLTIPKLSLKKQLILLMITSKDLIAVALTDINVINRK